jgi:anion-transporting  ArsA/GET3 family ATPase
VNPSLLERKLIVVSGKGGVGKTTVACALGLLAARRGLRTIVVEVSAQRRLPGLFGSHDGAAGVETELRKRLWSISIDPDRALLEWLQALGGRVSGRVLASSSTFQYFAAAAPGAKELVSMVKLWELAEGERRRGRERRYDLVVLDAPSTGHALGMLHSPLTFGAIARVGPIAAQAERVRELLGDPARSGYLGVAQPTEMAVTETLELQNDLSRRLGRELYAVVVNGVLPLRFDERELDRIASLDGGEAVGKRAAGAESSANERAARSADVDVRRSAALVARAVHERARFQRNQIARLRRRRFHVLSVPFEFDAELDLAAVTRISARLDRKL